jgi:hypothetical protein
MQNSMLFLNNFIQKAMQRRQSFMNNQNPLMPIQNLNTSGFGDYFGGQQNIQPQTSPQTSPVHPQQGVQQPVNNQLVAQPPFNGQLVNPDQKVNPKGGYNPQPPPQTSPWSNVAGGPNNPIATGDQGLKDWAAINQPGVSPWARPGG